MIPLVLYIGLTFTHSHPHPYTNVAIQGAIHVGVQCLAKDTEACGQLERGFEPPTLRCQSAIRVGNEPQLQCCGFYEEVTCLQ